MPGETDLHKTLKKEACRWLFRMGYRCIAAEVRLKPLGIIDAVGTGLFRPFHNYLAVPVQLPLSYSVNDRLPLTVEPPPVVIVAESFGSQFCALLAEEVSVTSTDSFAALQPFAVGLLFTSPL